MATVSRPAAAPEVHGVPAPLRGGPLALARFLARNRMLNAKYALLLARWAWLKLRWGRRLQTDGLCFVGPHVKLEIGRDAVLRLGRCIQHREFFLRKLMAGRIDPAQMDFLE